MGWMLHQQTLTVRRITIGGPDVDGVPATVETQQEWTGCQVQPHAAAEQTGGVERTTTRLLICGDLATWIASGDKVEVDGRMWRVEGEPRHFTTVLPHTEVVLVAWTGA